MGQMADRGHGPVVLFRVQDQGLGPDRLHHRQHPGEPRLVGAQRRHDVDRVLVKVRIRGLQARAFRPTHGMAAHVLDPRRQKRRHRAAQLGLGAAHVGHHGAGSQGRGRFGHQVGNGAHRRRENDHVRPLYPFPQIRGAPVHRAQGDGFRHRVGPAGDPPDAVDARRPAQGHPQGPAHQPKPYDGHRKAHIKPSPALTGVPAPPRWRSPPASARGTSRASATAARRRQPPPAAGAPQQ